jgi:hypothetical protein
VLEVEVRDVDFVAVFHETSISSVGDSVNPHSSPDSNGQSAPPYPIASARSSTNTFATSPSKSRRSGSTRRGRGQGLGARDRTGRLVNKSSILHVLYRGSWGLADLIPLPPSAPISFRFGEALASGDVALSAVFSGFSANRGIFPKDTIGFSSGFPGVVASWQPCEGAIFSGFMGFFGDSFFRSG